MENRFLFSMTGAKQQLKNVNKKRTLDQNTLLMYRHNHTVFFVTLKQNCFLQFLLPGGDMQMHEIFQRVILWKLGLLTPLPCKICLDSNTRCSMILVTTPLGIVAGISFLLQFLHSTYLDFIITAYENLGSKGHV